MVQGSTFKLLWLAIALQSGTLAAQTPASPDVPTPAQPTPAQTSPPAAQQIPIDPATGKPFWTREEVAARTPPAIRAMTEAEKVEYDGWLVDVRAAYQSQKGDDVVDLMSRILDREEATFGPDHPETLGTLTQIDQVLRTLARNAEAEPVANRAWQVSRAVLGERHPDTLTSLGSYAFLLQALGRADEAEPLLAAALRLFREVLGERHPDTLRSLNNYALVLQALGKAAEAEPLFAEVLRLNVEVQGERHPDTITSLNNYAGVLDALGRAGEAEPLYAEALRLYREVLGERHPDTLISLNNYAFVLDALGRAGEAEPLFAEALRLNLDVLGDSHPATLRSLNNYAYVLQVLGRAGEAELLLAEALRRYREALGERHPDTLTSLNNYASLLQSVGRAGEAEPLFAEAMRVRREVLGERHPDTLLSLNNYAFVLQALGRAGEAEPLYAEALRLTREVQGERHPATLISLNNYAGVFDALDREGEAEPLYSQALRLRREVLGERHPDTISSAQDIAYTRLRLPGSASEALSPARLALAALRSRYAETGERGVRGEAQQERDRVSVQATERLFADAAWVRAEAMPGEAAELRTESFAALQGAGAGAAARAIAQTAARRYAESAGAGPLVTERTLLVEQWAIAERKNIAAQAQSESQDVTARTTMDREMAAIESRIRAIDAELETKAPQYSAIVNQPPLDVAQAQALLGDDEAVLIVVPSGFGTQIMALTKTGLVWQRSDLGEDEVAQTVAKLRQDLYPDEANAPASEPEQPVNDFLRFDRATSYALYMALIDPVAASLVGKSTVFIAADGALASLPFGVLITTAPEPGSADDDLDIMRAAPWFADAHALVQIPSLQSLAYLRTFNRRSTTAVDTDIASGFAGYGDPLLNGFAVTRGGRGASLPPVDATKLTGRGVTDAGAPLMDPAELRKMASLPGTERELAAVRTMLGAPETSTWLLSGMTEARLRSADLSNVRILHLATHGLTASESGALAEPGLVFTPPAQATNEDDGYLAASEVLALDLRATDWVILSACNTAAPSGKPGEAGLSGLARAFFYAGASSLLVSHWPVFDSVAAEITVNALRRTQNGESRAAALQSAMRDIRNTIDQPEFAHPGAWAAFTLAGEGQ